MILKLFIFLFLWKLSMESVLAPHAISTNWFFRQAPSNSSSFENEWYPAQVPGFVHLDLMRNNLIPDPYYRDNEIRVQWIETVDWEYQTKFNVSAKILQSNMVQLRFEGLDTHASVYLNEELILKANNFFRSWVVNVKDKLKPADNILMIHFKSAVKHDNQTLEEFLPIIVPADNPNRTPFSRKPRYHYGWDWGPRLVTCGIHKKIDLVGYDTAKIKNFNLETIEIIKGNQSNSARVRAEAFVERASAEKQAKFQLIMWLTSEKSVLIDQGTIASKDNSSSLHYEKTFLLENVDLWWSRGLGNSKLYDFEFLLFDDFGKKEDVSKIRMGIRTVKLNQITDQDNNGSSFAIQLNGYDVFIKGANYIPPDSFSTRVTHKKHDQLISDIIGANYNGIRIWGGGYFESQYFYNKCDENGILIVHDFMFACEMYPGTPDYMANYQEEFIEKVLKIKSHPSIVLWIGNNEVNEAWNNWGFTTNLTEENVKVVWNWYLSIFEELFPKLISQYDSQRPYWPSSPLYGYGHPESLKYGDSHYWTVWAGGKPIEMYRDHVGRFMTEYGMQGILDINSIDLFTLPEDRNLNSSAIKNHEKHLKGFQYLNLYMNETHGILPTDFEDYIYVSQIMQSYAIELAVTSHRNHKPYCMGTLYWQLNDAWPALSWASVDHYGHWKALHYAARRFNQDLIMLGRENNGSNLIEIRALSELQTDRVVTVEIYVYDLKGNQKDLIVVVDYQLKAFSNEIVQTFKMEEKNKGKFFFLMRILDGEHIWENQYFMKAPKYLQLPLDANVQLTYSKNDKGIFVYSEVFVKNLYIYSENKYLKLENNYFDLLPNRKVFVQIMNFDEIGEEFKETDLKIKSFNEIIRNYTQKI